MIRNKYLETSAHVVIVMTAFLVPSMAQAQATTQDKAAASSEGSEKEIVVTGTLLRGVAPIGTNVIDLGREEIVATGASSTNDLLASIPQLGYFGTVPRGNQDAGSPLVQPSIRNLGPSGPTGTLVLMNGHRIVAAGVLQGNPDPSVIPPNVIQRVDVIPDGGSSVYGSDAIAGVINFVTRPRFDGVEVSGRYGAANSYQTVDGDIIAGRDWGSGSAYVAYSYSWHDNLLGADRDYATSDNRANGGSDLRSSACAPGNITIGATTYALPGRVAGTLNRCDERKAVDIYPREERHTVFGSIRQQLSPALEFAATAYWSRRETQIRTAQSTQTGTITALNPFFQPIGTEVSQNVAFSYAGVFGPSNITNQQFESYGVTPGFNFDLSDKWQIRAQANFGRSYSEIHEDSVNATAAALALASTNPATALNPYNLAASSPAVLASIENFENYSDGVHELGEARLVADGTLATLPGGDIRLAAGAEYRHESLRQRLFSAPRGTTGRPSSLSTRSVKAVFGELLIPLVGQDNGHPGLRGLTLSGSVRYDDYSDVGSTTNPKVGLTYQPFDDLKIRANYGTSFHAPALAAVGTGVQTQVQVLPVSPFRPVGSPFSDFLRPTIILAGGNANLRPETAKTWEVGFDWKPNGIPGLSANATYYNVDLKDAIGLPLIATLFTDPNFAPFITINPTQQQALAAANGFVIIGAPSIQSLYVGTSPFLLADARLNNFGVTRTDGIDFKLSYTRPLGKMVVNASIAGNYTLNRKLSTGAAGPFTDTLKNGAGRLFFVSRLTAAVNGFTAAASVNYRDGYPQLGLVNQTDVAAFTTVDLAFSYSPESTGLLRGTQFTLNVENLFDRDPPYVNTNIGFTNGSTLGRLISFGIRKKF